MGCTNVTDLLKSYGANDDSLLMTLCCQKNDSSSLRAQIFAFIARILAEDNQKAIEIIIKKNLVGLSALDYATMANNSKIAAFLAKLFYIFGQDLLCKDSQVCTMGPNYQKTIFLVLKVIIKFNFGH